MFNDFGRRESIPSATVTTSTSGVTSHLLEATSGFQTLTPADASPHWLNTLYTRYVIASTSGMTF